MPTAKVLASAEAIDEAKIIAHTFQELLMSIVYILLSLDSKVPFTSLSTERNSIHRSVRDDVACIRFNFHFGNIYKITWCQAVSI